jgi:hypothetical protein
MVTTLSLLAGLGGALWAQSLVGPGGRDDQALIVLGAYVAAVALFLLGVVGLTRPGQPDEAGRVAWPSGRARPAPGTAVPGAPIPISAAVAAPSAPARAGVARVRIPAIHARPLVAALLLGALTFLFNAGEEFTALGVCAWIASVALALVACWDPALDPALARWLRPAHWRAAWRARLGPALPAEIRLRAGAAWARVRSSIHLSATGMTLVAILTAGVFLSFYRLGEVPRDMTSDHAEKWIDALLVMDGHPRIFFPNNGGREALQFYLMALVEPFTGFSYVTIKLVTASVAILALPFAFLLGRSLFGTQVALLATALMAISRWRLTVSRIGLRYTFTPVFGAALLYFLFRALKDRRRRDFLLCGLVLGISQYTFTSFRVIPVAIVACLAIALAVDVWRRESVGRVHRFVVDSVLLFLVAGLVAMPLLRYAVDDPAGFQQRGLTRIFGDPGMAPLQDPVGRFLDNVKNALLMWNWKGDVQWGQHIPGVPVLDPISGALFALGCAYAAYRLLRYRELPYLYLAIMTFGALLPSILALAFPRENPHVGRVGISMPIVMLVAALPVALLVGRLRAALGGRAGAVAGGVLVAALFGAALRANYDQYFTIYARQHALASQHTSHVGRVVNAFLAAGGQRDNVHIMTWSHWFDTRLVAIETGTARWDPLIKTIDEVRKHDGSPGERLYIVHPDDQASRGALARWYPGAVEQVHSLRDNLDRPWFVTIRVPANATAAG